MGDASDFYEGCEENRGLSQDGIEEWEEETIEVDIKVKMGAETCGECPCVSAGLGGAVCGHLSVYLENDGANDDYLRCPACIEKYGTGDKPDPRDAVVSAAVRVYKGEEKDFEKDMGILTEAVNDYLCGNPQVDKRDAVVAAAREGLRAMESHERREEFAYIIGEIEDALDALDAEGGR